MTLQVDVSEEASGGVLLQEGPPVCFTSHTLDSTEKNYKDERKGASMPYWNYRDEISTYDGVIVKAHQVILHR